MTATSALPSPSLTAGVHRLQRLVALAFVMALIVAGAFAVGRASVRNHSGSPTISPTVAVVPAPTGAVVPCRLGHAC